MDADPIAQWLLEASERHDEAHIALVRVFDRVHQDHRLLHASVSRWRDAQQATFLQRSSVVVSALERGVEPPDLEGPEGALVALHALDQFVATGHFASDLPPRKVTFDGRAFWLLPRPKRWGSRYAEHQPNHMRHWIRRHWICPTTLGGIEIDVGRTVPGGLRGALLSLLGGSLRVYVEGFRDGVEPTRLCDGHGERTDHL